MERKNKKTEEKKFEPVTYFEIKRAHDAGTVVYFDLYINGVTVYGCRVVEGQKGDFIGWPSVKGKDGKYYNVCYMPLSDEDQKTIIDMVATMI